MRDARRPTWVGVLVVETGLLVTAVGLFAPWSMSGERSRNSFASASALADLLVGTAGAGRVVLQAWPGVVALLAVAAWSVVALRRAPAWITVLALALAAPVGVGVAVLATPDRGLVHVVHTGPTVSVLGAGVVVAGVILRLLASQHKP